jgi:uncharacterized protein YdaU (DUF1376 family)
MTKKVDTWMPLLVDKYLGDTMDLTTEQHGAYFLLLLALWKKDGVLPNDEDRLASITKMSPQRWAANRKVLMGFFRPTEDGTGITQKRLTEELQRSKEHTEAKAKAGKTGSQKRWQKHGTAMAEPRQSDGREIADRSQTPYQTGASTPPPILSNTTEHAPPMVLASAREGPEPQEPPGFRAALADALIAHDLPPTAVSLDDQRIRALAGQGATAGELAALAREALGKGVRNLEAWVFRVLPERRAEAAGLAPLAAAPDAAAEGGDDDFQRYRAEADELESRTPEQIAASKAARDEALARARSAVQVPPATRAAA